MGHYCRICDQHRPNEQFSGSGHKTHICKQCEQLPKGEIQDIEATQEISHYLGQSTISLKNLERLKTLTTSSNKTIAELAALVLEIGQLYPYKKKRFARITRERKDIRRRMEEFGIFETILPFLGEEPQTPSAME